MIPVPSDVRVWLAVGRTDMRRGMNGLALQVQEALGRDPHAGDLYVFRGARGDLIKNHLARRDRHVAVFEAAGAGSILVAVTGRRHGRHLGGAARLHARRHRLAEPAAYIPAAARRVDCCIFCESAAGIHDSIPAWRVPVTCLTISTR
jgi:hypothetical protein